MEIYKGGEVMNRISFKDYTLILAVIGYLFSQNEYAIFISIIAIFSAIFWYAAMTFAWFSFLSLLLVRAVDPQSISSVVNFPFSEAGASFYLNIVLVIGIGTIFYQHFLKGLKRKRKESVEIERKYHRTGLVGWFFLFISGLTFIIILIIDPDSYGPWKGNPIPFFGTLVGFIFIYREIDRVRGILRSARQ